jgi:SAM-dependent methyltransferase
MKLRRIKSDEEKERIGKILHQYYNERPDSYGLMDRAESEYEAYASVILKWTPQNGRVLDLGCGTYRTPQMIHQTGLQTTGCDLFSEEKLKAYREAVGPKGPKLVSYDGKTIPFEDNTFDTVGTLCVFEHVPDMEGMLREITRVLRPGGRLVILGPNLGGPHTAVLGLMSLIIKRQRFSHYPDLFEVMRAGIFQLSWTLGLILSGHPTFIYKYPFIVDGRLRFEQPDDDAIQLNLPVSYRNWFRKNGFLILQFNRGAGESGPTRFFNRIFPSFSTTNQIVAEKG